jgi:ribosomal protein S4
MRADVYLYTFGYVKSRQKAKTLIESGYVFLNGEKIIKPAIELDENLEYEISIKDPCPYVSRGGLKLEKILDTYNIDANGKIAIDIGASTGGFTHCLLVYGADKVYAVDSGTNQLDEALLDNEKVTISSVQEVIADILNNDVPPEVTVERIVDEVARTYGISPNEIRFSKNRSSSISNARHIAIYLTRELTTLSMEQIGKNFGNRHYSTIIYTISKVQSKMEQDSKIREIIEDTIKNIRDM